MGTGHALKETTRPVKKIRERKRRIKTQQARLIKLGVPETQVKKMTGAELRALLAAPEKTKKTFAKDT